MLSREAGIQDMVYLSATPGGEYTDVSHFTAKHTVERMIEQMDLPTTILRPSYFFQNDAMQKEPLQKAGLYVSPVGDVGVSMVDGMPISASCAATESSEVSRLALRRQSTRFAGTRPGLLIEFT